MDRPETGPASCQHERPPFLFWSGGLFFACGQTGMPAAAAKPGHPTPSGTAMVMGRHAMGAAPVPQWPPSAKGDGAPFVMPDLFQPPSGPTGDRSQATHPGHRPIRHNEPPPMASTARHVQGDKEGHIRPTPIRRPALRPVKRARQRKARRVGVTRRALAGAVKIQEKRVKRPRRSGACCGYRPSILPAAHGSRGGYHS